MSNAFNPVYQNSLRQDLEKKYESLSQSFNLKNKLNEHLTERVNELQKENKQLKQEYKEAKTLIEHYKNLYFDTKQRFNDFQKDVKSFIEERDLMQGFREFLYKLRPERYKNPNQTQEQSKARQTEPKRVIRTSTPSKGMER